MKNFIFTGIILFLLTFPIIGKTQALKVTEFAIRSVNKSVPCDCNKSNTVSPSLYRFDQYNRERMVLLGQSSRVFDNYGVFNRQLVPLSNRPLRIIQYNTNFTQSIIKPLQK